MAKMKMPATGDATTAQEAAAKPTRAKKVKEPVIAPEANGKDVFEGTVGSAKYIFDAGNGETILELVPGTPVADQAQAIGRTLVPRSAASKYALNLLFKSWRTARPASKAAAKAQEPVAA